MSDMTRTISYAEALNEALHEEMQRDAGVFVLGEDIGILGGLFQVTKWQCANATATSLRGDENDLDEVSKSPSAIFLTCHTASCLVSMNRTIWICHPFSAWIGPAN